MAPLNILFASVRPFHLPEIYVAKIKMFTHLYLLFYIYSPSLTINDVPIKQISHTKSLDVHLDENLTWNVHIEKLCKKVASINAYKAIRPTFHNATYLQLLSSPLFRLLLRCLG